MDLSNLPNKTMPGGADPLASSDSVILNSGGAPRDADLLTLAEFFSRQSGFGMVAIPNTGVIDLASGRTFSVTVSGNTAFSLANLPGDRGVDFRFLIRNGGSAVLTFWSGLVWSGGSAPTLKSSGYDLLHFLRPLNDATTRGWLEGSWLS